MLIPSKGWLEVVHWASDVGAGCTSWTRYGYADIVGKVAICLEYIYVLQVLVGQGTSAEACWAKFMFESVVLTISQAPQPQ